jgi:hypothetical protein
MKITTQQTEQLLNGCHKFAQLSFSMMLTRLKTRYAKSPTPAVLKEATAEINTFLEKFSEVMPNDCAIISDLRR